MRYWLFLIFVSLWLDGHGQACGFYEINYKGKVKSEKVIREIWFPAGDFLIQWQGQTPEREKWVANYQKALFQDTSVANFNHKLRYQTCSAGALAKTRINWIKERTTFLPLLVITNTNKKIWVRIPLDQIEFQESKKDKYLIEINFKEITI